MQHQTRPARLRQVPTLAKPAGCSGEWAFLLVKSGIRIWNPGYRMNFGLCDLAGTYEGSTYEGTYEAGVQHRPPFPFRVPLKKG